MAPGTSVINTPVKSISSTPLTYEYKRSPLVLCNQLRNDLNCKTDCYKPSNIPPVKKKHHTRDLDSSLNLSPSTPTSTTLDLQQLSLKLLHLEISPKAAGLKYIKKKKRDSLNGSLNITPQKPITKSSPLKSFSSPFKIHHNALLNSPQTWARKLDRKSKSKCDRYIPSTGDIQHAQFHISRTKSPTKFNSVPVKDPEIIESSSFAYQFEVAKACGLALDRRVLNLNQTKDNKNCLKSTYCRPLKQYKTTSAKRKIPVVPEKILDAPGILDDLYLNLLDWSTGNKLAVGLGPSVYLWDATVGNVEELCSFDDDDPIASVSWSLDGTHLAVSNFVGETHLFDVSTSQIVRTISSHNVRIGALSWNERVMSSGSENGSIHNHDVRIAHSKVSEYNGHSSDVCGLKWSFDGSQLASGGNDNFVNIWDIRTSSARFSNNEHTASVKALAWCQWQSNLLASGGGANDEKIVFWNTSTGTKDSVIHTGSQVTQLVFSKSYREILSSHGSSQNSLTLWKYPSLQKVCDIPQAHQSSILHLAISPDGQTVCSGAGDESLKFWKLFNIDTKKRVKGIGSVEVQKGKSPDFGMLNIR